ncbi:hypothetical protein ACHQM5_018732 [Ranunculus cassubicifolius]
MKISLGCVLLVLLLIFSHETMEMVDAKKICEVKSLSFKGICLSNRKCNSACIMLGHDSGRCKGWRRHCYCRLASCPIE